jgi:L-threonylcarbamoyladenylate synthase
MSPTVADAARVLEHGGLVVYPTDTLLGLAARASDRRAVVRLEALKGIPSGQPISVAVSSLPEIESLSELSPAGRRFVRVRLPGPYTVLVPPSSLARTTLAPRLFAAGRTLGLRLPDHPVARELARRVGPITATSANFHGQPPCPTVRHARRVFGRKVAVYLAARPPVSGRPSTLVDLAREEPRVIARR